MASHQIHIILFYYFIIFIYIYIYYLSCIASSSMMFWLQQAIFPFHLLHFFFFFCFLDWSDKSDNTFVQYFDYEVYYMLLSFFNAWAIINRHGIQKYIENLAMMRLHFNLLTCSCIGYFFTIFINFLLKMDFNSIYTYNFFLYDLLINYKLIIDINTWKILYALI